MVQGKIVKRSVMPDLDGNNIAANVRYPDGTPAAVTDQATQILERAIWLLNDKYTTGEKPAVVLTHRMVGSQASVSMTGGPGSLNQGSHVASVLVELAEASDRTVHSKKIVDAWRATVLDAKIVEALPPGYDSLTFQTANIGPGGIAIEFSLLASPEHMEELEAATEQCKAYLADKAGVFDIVDDSRPGKWEFQLAVKDRAKAMGVSQADLAETVRAAYYGQEVMRLQRGRHEVKLMVRYPRDERRSLAGFNEIRVRTGDRSERPITELARVDVKRGYSTITRLDQMRAIAVTADVDEETSNAKEIVTEMKNDFLPVLLAEHPHLRVRWGGQQEQEAESIAGLIMGLAIALACMFALLTLEFRSYLQPMLILAIVPFGAIGAVLGHWILGLPVSLFSLFGIVALTGVVINDSIVLIDFMNSRTRAGMPLLDAIVEACRRRFRPVMLTSLTTIAALLPILLERSMQAQVVIPMAVSLAFGLMFATVLVLVMVPTLYMLYVRVTAVGPIETEPEAPPPWTDVERPEPIPTLAQ
jgi:HAE1 family hydrophobic/amphiphilic exporter-1